MNNIIQIIPRIYITNIYNESILLDYHIDNMIIIDRNITNDYKENNKLFINPEHKNYDITNKHILESYKKNQTLMIIDELNINAIIIISIFIIKYLNMNLVETLQLIKMRTNLDHKDIPIILLKELFDYYL